MALRVHIVETMSFSRAVASPLLRIPLLIGTVIATVATSPGPEWTLGDETPFRAETLAAGQSVEMTAKFDASHPVSTSVRFENFDPRSGQLRVERLGGCTFEKTFHLSQTAEDGLSVFLGCAEGSDQTTNGDLTVRVTNFGSKGVQFDWQLRASIRDGGDEAPDDAFVNIEIVQ